MMESSPHDSPADSAAALLNAEASRDALARQFDPGVLWFTVLAVSIATHIALTAIGVTQNSPLVFIAGQLVFAVMTSVQIWLLRRSAGMRVGAFTSKVVLGFGVAATAAYGIGLGGAFWAAFESQWLLTVLCATAGGIGYALAGRRWLRRYHERPQDLSPTASTWYLIAAFVLAGVALVILIVNQ